MKKIFIIVALFATKNAVAQTEDIKTMNSPIIIHKIDDIVIAATKTLERKKNLAQQIQTIDVNEIKLSNAQNTVDVLQNSAAVNVQKSQQGGGSPTIRGFEASRVLLVVDGVRMNNLIFRGGHLQNLINVDENFLERIDVLYGPASTMYGSDALGGAIHLSTANPKLLGNAEKKLTGEVLARYGSVNGENKLHAKINYAKEKFASLTGITYTHIGDLRMGKNPFGINDTFGLRNYYVAQFNNKDSAVVNKDPYLQVGSGDYNKYDFMQKFIFEPNNNTSHKFSLLYSTTEEYNRYDRLTDVNGSTKLKNAIWYYGPQKWLNAGYDLQKANLINSFNGHIGLHYQQFEESRHNRGFNKPTTTSRIEKVNTINLNVDLNKATLRGVLRIGLEGSYEKLQSTATQKYVSNDSVVAASTRYPNGDNRMTRSDVYFNYSHNVNSIWKINVGGRLGYTTLYSTHDDSIFYQLPYNTISQKNATYSATAGVVCIVNPNVKLSANLSTGYRAPNVDDLSKIFETAPGTLIVPNESLKPEQTITPELGITFYNSDFFTWENTLYHTMFTNAIVAAPFTYNGADSVIYDGTLSAVIANQNKRKAYLYGFSSFLKTKISHRIFMTAGINYTYGRIEETDTSTSPLDHIPPLFGRMGLTYDYRKIQLDFSVNFNGRKRIEDYYLNGEDNEQYAPANGSMAWAVYNIRGSYKIHKNATLQAGVDNIMDTQYRTFASGINGAGRNIYAALRLNF